MSFSKSDAWNQLKSHFHLFLSDSTSHTTRPLDYAVLNQSGQYSIHWDKATIAYKREREKNPAFKIKMNDWGHFGKLNNQTFWIERTKNLRFCCWNECGV